jgi:membrane associated rhomboid family serine protease
MVQLRLGWTLERQNGFWRIGPIYILSGFAGNLASCIFLPNTITVGASGAAFGLGGVLVADLILNWTIVQRPYINAITLTAR